MSQATLARRCVAEALGTGLLVAAVVGSGIMAEKLAGGNAALALLCNAIATGAILVVLILAFGSISGAHFNPVVSLVMMGRGALTDRDGAAYLAAQLVGGCAGAVLANLMFDLAPVSLAATPRAGAGLWLAEAVATFGLVLTILAVARERVEALPYAVGLYIASAYWFTASTSFANPAVTLARTLSNTFAGIAPHDAPAFMVAQCVGAFAAQWLAGWLWASSRA